MMKGNGAVVLLILFLRSALSAQEHSINYLNCPPPPADSLVVFAKGIVSLDHRWEEKICFTRDGKEVFFGINDDGGVNYFKPRLMHATYRNNKWSTPDTAAFPKDRFVGWPVLNLKGTILFMEEVVGKTDKGVRGQVVFSRKINGHWSEIESVAPAVEAREGFGLGQITDDSTFYFYDRYDRIAYFSRIVKGEHTTPVPLPCRINPAVEFFVSPGNDYIIFKPLDWSNQFHIGFHEGENEWSMPVPFSAFFTKKKGWDGSDGYGPYISPDGKYLFIGHLGDIYWVKTDFIEVLKEKTYE